MHSISTFLFRVLYLNDNALRSNSFPRSFIELRHLSVLWIQNNRLKSVPNEIGELVSLQHLNAGHNQIKTITHRLFSLPKLKSLWLNNNDISCIPQQIGNLLCIETLDLQHNCLKQLPSCLETMPRLKVLKLDGNRLSNRQMFKFEKIGGNGNGGLSVTAESLQKRASPQMTANCIFSDKGKLEMAETITRKFEKVDFSYGWCPD